MKFYEKLKFCKKLNSDPIYQEYSHGCRCCCFKDVHGVQRLQVMHLGYHHFVNSTICNDWEKDYMLEWIMRATQNLKVDLGLVASEIPF